MTDNSTAKKRTPHDREKDKDEIEKMLDALRALRARVHKIREAYPWKPEYNTELEKLVNICKDKHNYTLYVAEWPGAEYFEALRRGGFYAPSTTLMHIHYAVDLIENFPEDLHNALSDGGEQSSLFPDEEKTPAKVRIWRRHTDKPADIRRLEILAQRALLEAAEYEIDAWVTPAPRRNPRTKTRAGDNLCGNYPAWLAIPTREGIRNALSCIAGSGAYLQNAGQDVQSIGELAIRQGRFFIAGEGRAAEERDLEELVEDGKIKAEDTALMAAFYSFCWNRYEETGESGEAIVYAPDFMRYIGVLPPKDKAQRKSAEHSVSGASHAEIKKTVQRASALNKLIGVLPGKGIYAAFLFKGYDEDKNTIAFESPYIDRIIEDAKQRRARLEAEANKAKKAKKRAPVIPPENAYLIKSAIVAAKNAVAVNNVFNIVRLIETAGADNVPHITYRNLIKQNPELCERIKNSTNCTQLLKRVFVTTWEYLKKYTRLKEKYPTIEIPDNITYPTMRTLDEVIRFPHPSATEDKMSAKTTTKTRQKPQKKREKAVSD